MEHLGMRINHQNMHIYIKYIYREREKPMVGERS